MSETLLTLNDVHLTFPAQKNWRGKVIERVYALNGLDMTASRGETLGIVGESGCGKSTLAKLLMGMLKPSSGQFSRPPPPVKSVAVVCRWFFKIRCHRWIRVYRSGARSPSRCGSSRACAKRRAAISPSS